MVVDRLNRRLRQKTSVILVPILAVKSAKDVKVEGMTALAVKAKLKWHYDQRQREKQNAKARSKREKKSEATELMHMRAEDKVVAGFGPYDSGC